MTTSNVFDTHRYIKNLKNHGFTEQQAEGLAEEQVKMIDENLATKTDIAGIHQDINHLLRWL